MISIVLPTYNGEKYIKQSVDSILKQTFEDWELIIVDDCSTDNTLAIAEEYCKLDKRIRCIHNEVNKKTPTSVNIGFSHAKGDLFTWTSDDNVFKPEALERMYKEFTNDRSVDLVYTNFTIIDQDDYILFELKAGPTDEIYKKNVIGACFLYKRAVHETLNGYNKNKFLVDDYDFWIRAYKKFKFKHIEENLYYYRIHNSALGASRDAAVQRGVMKIVEENYHDIPKDSLKLRHDTLSMLSKFYLKEKKYLKAFKYYLINIKK